MKKISILTVLMITLNLYAQQAQIVVVDENGNDVGAFTTLKQALNAAPNNATYYIPGGNFTCDSIAKKVHFVGAGFHSDSTLSTNKTTLNSLFDLYDMADGSIFEGLNITGAVYVSSNNIINNITIKRCRLVSLVGNFKINNLSVVNSVIISTFTNTKNSTVSNSYIGSWIDNNENCIFKNCIMKCPTTVNCKNIVIKNSYIKYQDYISATNLFLTFINNLIIDTVVANSSYVYSNNIINQSFENTFQSGTLNSSYEAFNELTNYQLKSTSLGKNAGDDGTDIGIYGGAYSWKEGAVPSNPHISKKIIGGQTDNNGNLNINVTVRGQSY